MSRNFTKNRSGTIKQGYLPKKKKGRQLPKEHTSYCNTLDHHSYCNTRDHHVSCGFFKLDDGFKRWLQTSEELSYAGIGLVNVTQSFNSLSGVRNVTLGSDRIELLPKIVGSD
uniref:Uncharacterized protein n=1 Tax=Cacopsylla melanoneura TaxID=428564 RepID=A0A8D8ZL23_9HEMI